MKNTPGDIIILQMCTKNYDHMMYGTVPEICCTTEGWTDRKSDIGVDAPPKNKRNTFDSFTN